MLPAEPKALLCIESLITRVFLKLACKTKQKCHWPISRQNNTNTARKLLIAFRKGLVNHYSFLIASPVNDGSTIMFSCDPI